MSTGTNSIQVGAWVAGVFLIALGLLAVFFPAGAYGEKSFFGLLSLPVGVTVLMSLLIERWWPVGRRTMSWRSR